MGQSHAPASPNDDPVFSMQVIRILQFVHRPESVPIKPEQKILTEVLPDEI
jgi:hypothetical protein